MSGINEQIAIKNGALNRMNQSTGNVYDLQTQGGRNIAEVAEEKQAASTPGDVPGDFWADDLKITSKDWKIVALAVGITALLFFILLQTKIIKF